MSTPSAAPVIAAARLCKGSTSSARGAARLVSDALVTAAKAGATGVDLAEIARAVRDRELPAVSTHPRRPGIWMMRSSDIDVWALWALGRPTAGTAVPDVPA